MIAYAPSRVWSVGIPRCTGLDRTMILMLPWSVLRHLCSQCTFNIWQQEYSTNYQVCLEWGIIVGIEKKRLSNQYWNSTIATCRMTESLQKCSLNRAINCLSSSCFVILLGRYSLMMGTLAGMADCLPKFLPSYHTSARNLSKETTVRLSFSQKWLVLILFYSDDFLISTCHGENSMAPWLPHKIRSRNLRKNYII